MGCSASRPDMLLSKAVEGSASYLSSSRSNPLFDDSSVAPSSSVPIARSLTAPLVHHLPTWEGDTHHLVSLTSTTYGSLILVDRRPSVSSATGEFDARDCTDRSHSPDSVINTWELMEGLDDEDGESNFDCGQNPRRSIDTRKNTNSRMDLVCADSINNKLSDSFVFVEKPHENAEEWSSNLQKNSKSNSKPLWKHLSEESLLSKLDPNVASTYERAISSRQLGTPRPTLNTRSVSFSPLPVSKLSSLTSSPLPSTPLSNDELQKSSPDNKIVLYFTSLRGIRKTYDDCCTVRMIFKGLRVPVDERDISMDSAYRKELKDALNGKAMSLPQVFIKGKHVGGADDIKQMNEDGELARLLDGFPVLKDSGFVCDACGDARFVPCGSCSGSRKVYEEEEGKMRRCTECNENVAMELHKEMERIRTLKLYRNTEDVLDNYIRQIPR
ncbi:hypothetical protein V2J09_023992 [Rumex salicifolius]